jgi:hypothetical protein
MVHACYNIYSIDNSLVYILQTSAATHEPTTVYGSTITFREHVGVVDLLLTASFLIHNLQYIELFFIVQHTITSYN